MTFAELTRDAHRRVEVVARFLAVLVFFRQGVLQFRQAGPFETLHLRWVEAPGAPVWSTSRRGTSHEARKT